MTTLKTKYFRAEKHFLLYGGNPLDEDKGLYYKIYSIILLLLCNVYPFLSSINLLTQNFNDALNGWFYTFCAMFDTAIAIFGYIGRKPLGKLLKKLEQSPFSADKDRGNEEEENKMLEAWSSFFKKQVFLFSLPKQIFRPLFQTFVMLFGTFVVISYRLVYSLTKRYVYSEWILPWSSVTLLNASCSPNYEILMLYQNTVFLYYCFTTMPLVLITTGSLSMMSVQFRMLHRYLSRILQLSAEKKFDSEKSDRFYWSLNAHVKNAVNYHLEIYKTVKEIDRLFNGAFLCVFLFTLLLICFDIYQASLTPEFNLKQMFFFIEVATVFSPALVYCYYGEEITHRSNQIGQVVYEIDFVGTDIRLQKSLMMIIRQSQKLLRIKAGNIIEGSMTVVVSIIRASYSAYMMLRTINKPTHTAHNIY